MNEQSRAVIQRIIDNHLEGWEKGDARLATQDYAEDADWTNAFGVHCKGRAEIEEFFTRRFTQAHVMGVRTEVKEMSIRFVRDDVAIVRLQTERKGQLTPSGESLGIRHTTAVRVLVNGPQGWQIV